MKQTVKKVLVWMIPLVAILVAAFSSPHWFEASAQAEVSNEVRDSQEIEAPQEVDIEALLESARVEERETLMSRVGVEEPPADPHLTLEERMTKAVIQENPWYKTRPGQARRLARIILDAAIDHDQNPWIALALSCKESSFSPGVGNLSVTGDLDEEGYFQIMPRGYARAICGKGRSMGNARANADTAMCFVSEVQSICSSEDPWVYVNAYGMNVAKSGCPSPERGKRMRPAKRTREILCRMVGEEECSEVWPS